LNRRRVRALLAGAIFALIVPAPESLFETYEISTAVNRAANDTAAVIAPLGSQPAPAVAAPSAKPKKKDDGQASLF